MVEMCLQEAARTIALTTPRSQIYPRGIKSAWVDVRDREMALIDQKHLRTVKPRLVPGARAIDRANAIEAWRALVPPGHFDILLLRAGGVRWGAICERDGRSRWTLQKFYRDGLLAIAAAISADPKLGLSFSP